MDQKKGSSRAPQEQKNCPRCNSINTKFCYYNNYSLTQPRYFCKTCRRYWTEGGSLRNVPVGGGSRKNIKKPNNNNFPKVPDLNPPLISPKILQGGGHDLNLAFPSTSMDLHDHKYHHGHGMPSSSSPSSPYVDMMPKLETGDAGHHPNYVHSLMPNNNASSLYPPSGFPINMQEVIRPSLGFSVPYGGVHENGGRLLFPFGEIKQLSNSSAGAADHVNQAVDQEQNIKDQANSTGFWTGMIGEGSSWD